MALKMPFEYKIMNYFYYKNFLSENCGHLTPTNKESVAHLSFKYQVLKWRMVMLQFISA